MRQFLTDLFQTAWFFTLWVLMPAAAITALFTYLPA